PGVVKMGLTGGWLAGRGGRRKDRGRWLGAAQAAPPSGPSRHGPATMESATCFFLALHRCLDGDLATAEPASRRAAELELELGNSHWRARTLSLLGAILYWRGPHAHAPLILEQVIRPAPRSVDKLASLFALSSLAAISARQRDPEAAEWYAREAALTAHHRVTVIADLTSADLLANRGELAAAETAALAAL